MFKFDTGENSITKICDSIDQATLNDLIEMLTNDDGIIRHRAHHALVEIGEPAVKPLINALKSQNDFLRWEAVKVLGQIGSLKAIPALIDTLEDEHHTIRWLAAESLIVTNLAGLGPLLSELRMRPDSVRLREGVHHVLHALTKLEKTPQAVQEAVLPILEALDDGAPASTIDEELLTAWPILTQQLNNKELSKTMEIPLNVEIHCRDGLAGHSTTIILNPVTREVTHLVVRERKAPHTHRIVPLGFLGETVAKVIILQCTTAELSKMENFIETEYIAADKLLDGSHVPDGAMAWPYHVRDAEHHYAVQYERIPPHELAVRRGTQVMAVDGRIGMVEAFVVEPTNGHITHLTLREGHLWGKKSVTIPVSEIDRLEKNTIYLKMDKRTIEKLPSIQVRKMWL